MKQNYKFVLYEYDTQLAETSIEKGAYIDSDGNLKTTDSKKYCVAYFLEVKDKTNKPELKRYVTIPSRLNVQTAKLIELDSNYNIIKTTALIAGSAKLIDYVILQDETYFYHIEYYGIEDKSSLEVDFSGLILFYEGLEVVPHYKTLSKKFKKEQDQQFFRASYDGKITLFGEDYKKVAQASINSQHALYTYKDSSLYIASTFNKTDCKYDHSKKSVELKLTIEDLYTTILDKYDNDYDLIKLAPRISKLNLTKRPAFQLYIQGANTITTYFGGVYKESEVQEIIDDADILKDKYNFGKIQTFQEINLTGLTVTSFNGLYSFNGIDKWVSPSGPYFGLVKVYSAGESFTPDEPIKVYHLSTGTEDSGAVNASGYGGIYIEKDIYRIALYAGEITQDMYYLSTEFYSITAGLLFNLGTLTMESVVASLGDSFNLSEFVVDYIIWARLICGDIPGLADVKDIPADDFVIDRTNYKKCAALGVGTASYIYQTDVVSEKPTKYGVNDYNKYFTNDFLETLPPYVTLFPLGRSAWVNTSLWNQLRLDAVYTPEGTSFEDKYSEAFVLKDSFHIADVIKALLAIIDPSITHEYSAEYSEFLYSEVNPVIGESNYQIYITPKSNILKGNYDQAAQKAEISFKELMNMLRDCYRCYWFIDDKKRFRLEHITYFMRGGTYSTNQQVQLDLTARADKFNKRRYSFFQNETEYDKTDLNARYEFNWSDNSSDAMGNIAVDIKDQYVQKDKTEEIVPNKFSSDIDLMLLLPNDFGDSGFALIMASSTKNVPIITNYLWDETREAAYSVQTQNYKASWHNLLKFYWYDMPGIKVSYNTIPPASWVVPSGGLGNVQGVKKSMLHTVQFPAASDPELNQLIRTEIGEGSIDELSINLDTRMAEATLRYTPK